MVNHNHRDAVLCYNVFLDATLTANEKFLETVTQDRVLVTLRLKELFCHFLITVALEGLGQLRGGHA